LKGEGKEDSVAKQSAGLIMYRCRDSGVDVLLIHPGGPYWAKKDDGAWTIPKGEIEEEEEAHEAAQREFEEETGLQPRGHFYPLTPVRLKSGKTVYAWAFEGDWDPTRLESTTFTTEWPPRSGRIQEYPEADRAEWFTLTGAKEKIQGGQLGFLRELETLLGDRTGSR
jgi:predicted NUDIX family NTP pyrophosphohydrolase